FGLPAGYRSLASVVKNELITVVGNALVLPVAAGYKVSKSYIVQRNEAGEKIDVTLFDHYKPLTPVPPYRISVPTKGVFLEAVQGQCDACEKIKENSAQDWTKFTTDEPTSIATLTPPMPTITDWKAAFKDFAAPIINIQNAPAEPAPGAGLTGLSELMGKAGIFKDVTGLDANQQNVIRTYLSNQENAKAFAEMAKTMAMQSHNTQNSEKIMDSLKIAKDTGAINQEDYGKLVKDHIQTQIDGGEGKKAEIEQQKNAKPSLTDAAIQAVDKGKDVKAQKTDNQGNSESIEINSSEPEKILARVEGLVPLLKQENVNACWATAATMMVSWKKSASLTVPQVLTEAGDQYLQKFNNKQPLKASEKDDFIATLDMVSEQPASYGLQQYIDWLKAYGPLWITTDASEDEDFSPHARILIEITGSGSPDGKDTNFTFYDPATRTLGPESETFLEFIKAFEQMATDNKSDTLIVQVVHFAEKYNAGPTEGFQIQGPWNINNPVHENITLASLLNSSVSVPAGVSVGSDKPTNEFFRGVIWNDDPALLLFDDKKKDNWDFSSGIMWKNRFDKGGKATTNDLRNFTGRSHYWDLQFFHGMASAVGEDPKDTLAKILLWTEFTYKSAIGEIADSVTLGSVPITSEQVSGTNTYTYTINSFFNTLTDPAETRAIAYLFSRGTVFTGVDNSKRIIGSLMHLVQDSFARGHVKRILTNPADLVAGSTDQFKPGKYGIYGEIENFHCYKGQDHKMHDKYDTLKGSDPRSLTSFDVLLGGRDAIGHCVSILNFWNAKTSYAAGPKDLFENQIFKLAGTATPADTTV
ncbi:MAG: papain-like cysteine protease family protein, partial [Flavitalea sp.]